MDNMSELIACVDPEELFQASIFTNLNDILVRKRLEKLKKESRKPVNISAEGALSGEVTHSPTHSLTHLLTYLLTHSQVAQASPEIYYWYGMYHMKKGTVKSYAKAKVLFTEAGTHSLTHPLTYSLTYLLTYSLTHSLTYSLTYLLTYSLTHSLTHLLTYLLTHSLTHWLTHSLTHSLTLTHSF